MLLSDTFLTACHGVRANTTRSLLTMLGIIIGVASVVLMSAVGASMQHVILGQISSLGSHSMVIFPGRQEGGPNALATGHDSLTFEDLKDLKNLKSIATLAPVIFLTGRTSYGSEEGSPQVFGVVTDFFHNQNIAALRGRLLDDGDVDGAKPVATIGPDVVDKFFGSQDPIGKRIKIGGQYFTVIGVSRRLGSQFFQNADNRIYLPFTLARTITGQKYLNYITMQATGGFDVAFADIKDLLRRNHGINNPQDDEKKDDFVVHSSEQANQILGAVSLGLTAFITTIATISLVVGGIGIMNIMLVSVTERTQEIGLRKAVGARRRDLLLQFLVEAVMLTSLGGLVGIVLGVGSAFFIAAIVSRYLPTYSFAVSLPSVALALLMAGMTGLLFGIAPARRAAALPPMEALRYE